MNTEEIKTLKSKVEFILEKHPESRNSDKVLTILLWKEFCIDYIRVDDRGRDWLYLDNIMELPSQDGIKRVRADIQNVDKRFLPTSLEVAKERGWLEIEWKKALGYHTGDSSQVGFGF